MSQVVMDRQPARYEQEHARSRWLLLALGLGIVAAWTAAVLLAPGRNPLVVYNGAFAVAFCLYLAASAVVLRAPGSPATLALVLVLALAPRVVLLTSTPALSDDLYRYIWDGKVIAAGINPYRYAPDAPELAALRGPLWPPINQKTQHTPYPPAAELVFAATYQLAPDSVKAQQVVAILGDLLAIGALLLLLGRLGLPRERVLLYAWSPTPALHFAHSAHHDALMIAAMVLALALTTGTGATARHAVSGLALALAGLIKLVPLLLAPLLVRRWRAAGTLTFAVVLALGAAPWLLASAALTGLGAEASEAVFNDSLHYVFVRLLGHLTAAPERAAGLLAAGILGAVALALAARGARDDLALVRQAAALLGLALLLNAVVEPWYLAWLLPFVAVLLRRGAGRLPFALTPILGWLWLSGAAQLTDLTYLSSAAARWWPLIRAVEYGPLFVLLALACYRAVRAQPAMAQSG
ncbi:MAG: glycosyltransferase 87 family protein [Thermomicrobiales bacterium]